MANIKMLQSEGKNSVIYSFSYGYLDADQSLNWVEGAVKASRSGDKWSFDFAKVSNQNYEQFESYRTLLEKVNQVVETAGTNLFGITVEKPKPTAKAKQS